MPLWCISNMSCSMVLGHRGAYSKAACAAMKLVYLPCFAVFKPCCQERIKLKVKNCSCNKVLPLSTEASIACPQGVANTVLLVLLDDHKSATELFSDLQGLLLLLCALGPEEINEVRLGPLTPYAVRTLRHLKDFFAVTFSIKPEADSQTLFLRCIGSGHKNMSKRVT